jgi:hypothetical protein
MRVGRDSVVGTATRYGLDGPVSNPGGGEIFRTRPDRPWCPPSLLCNGHRVSFPGVKRPGRGVDHQPPSSADVKEGVDLYLYSSSGPSWPVTGDLYHTFLQAHALVVLRCFFASCSGREH